MNQMWLPRAGGGDCGWVREGDIQAGPMGAENSQEGRAPATHIPEGPSVWTVTGLREKHVHQATLNSHPLSCPHVL